MDAPLTSPELATPTSRRKWWPWIVIGVALVMGAVEWMDWKEKSRTLAQQIIDENVVNNTLDVDHIQIPIFLALPFSSYFMEFGMLPSEYSGYFTTKRKDGSTLSPGCRPLTMNYSVRAVGGGRIAMELPGETMFRLADCQV